ncbi:hypothetical protein GYMLUDRAFT_579685 [Collybiopsis luxurians FD-317 M1]|uniref:Uncharacterized protein n=1 Tax=Collybiopsis luxurians FD-317 M1 TaxID=944289 RepID=A0A0D0CY95_9AGAR|nr:hypothetical protein GYMLUDRAFT_579685 [Collybiopsis luxurians FD-317 M1]
MYVPSLLSIFSSNECRTTRRYAYCQVTAPLTAKTLSPLGSSDRPLSENPKTLNVYKDHPLSFHLPHRLGINILILIPSISSKSPGIPKFHFPQSCPAHSSHRSATSLRLTLTVWIQTSHEDTLHPQLPHFSAT